MKEYDYYFKSKDGRLRHAMTPNIFMYILLIFWLLPFIALFFLIYHSIKSNIIIMPKKKLS